MGVIRDLCVSVSMDESLCARFVSCDDAAGLGPQPKVCSCSPCQSRANFLTRRSLSSPPPYLPYPTCGHPTHTAQSGHKRDGVVFMSRFCLTSAGDWDRVKKKKKNPHVLAEFWVCAYEVWPHMEGCPIYLCASHFRSSGVDETQ